MSIYSNLRGDGELSLADYEARVIGLIREQVGDGQVVLGLSGGVDSSVCAALLAKAVPGRLHCIFVDHGLMRLNEGREVEAAFRDRDLNLICIDAEDRFLTRLAGVTDPEQKRMIIGEEFIRVFEEESRKLKDADFLAQGTIFPDVAESGSKGKVAVKSHHNVGGLPDDIDFKGLVEPLYGLYKPEVRALGRSLGLPASLTERQPFPGPGLAVRCLGEVTKAKLDILREADAIFCRELEGSGVKADQYFAALLSARGVGIVDGERAYGYTIALRAIATVDFVTAQYVPLPHELLGRVSGLITSALPAVTRVLYDVTDKPPGTVEWE
ncbi:MAG: glutamine-hydrolyzing GMP synthase [Oscillospiraceae bacterium]|nr:glutamine-hydrolyzing GMP synthase [Oscillospiraceae bacterium]